MADFKAMINGLNQKISNFFRFIGMKLKTFKNLTLGEQISFGACGTGLVLIITSAVLFIF